MYNPLSYQINAVLYKVFGISITTLMAAGTVVTFLILLSLYAISRLFVNRYYSITACVIISSLYMFTSNTCINYFFPYAYAFPYSMLGFTTFVLLTLLYIKYDNKKLILPAALCFGFSIANKYEYILSILPFLGLLIYKKEKIKYYLYSISGFLFPLLTSWGILFLQGFTVSDLQNYLDFIHRFFSTKEQQIYNARINFAWNLTNFKTVAVNLFSTFSYITFGVTALKSIISKKTRAFGIILIPLFILTTFIFIKKIFITQTHIFSWISLAVTFALLINIKNSKTKQGLMLNILSIFGILAAFRLNFLCIGQGYQIFISPILFLAGWIYFLKIKTKFFAVHNLKLFISYILLFFSLTNIIVVFYAKYTFFETLKTSKGTIKNNLNQVRPFKQTIDWVNTNTKKSDTIIMLPEGAMMNFITDRKTDLRYYHLIPNHIKALNEDKIVEDFSKNKPDYFMINNENYSNYGAKNICKDFGFKICSFIYENYDYITRFDSKDISQEYMFIEIYKRKP